MKSKSARKGFIIKNPPDGGSSGGLLGFGYEGGLCTYAITDQSLWMPQPISWNWVSVPEK